MNVMFVLLACVSFMGAAALRLEGASTLSSSGNPLEKKLASMQAAQKTLLDQVDLVVAEETKALEKVASTSQELLFRDENCELSVKQIIREITLLQSDVESVRGIGRLVGFLATDVGSNVALNSKMLSDLADVADGVGVYHQITQIQATDRFESLTSLKKVLAETEALLQEGLSNVGSERSAEFVKQVGHNVQPNPLLTVRSVLLEMVAHIAQSPSGNASSAAAAVESALGVVGREKLVTLSSLRKSLAAQGGGKTFTSALDSVLKLLPPTTGDVVDSDGTVSELKAKAAVLDGQQQQRVQQEERALERALKETQGEVLEAKQLQRRLEELHAEAHAAQTAHLEEALLAVQQLTEAVSQQLALLPMKTVASSLDYVALKHNLTQVWGEAQHSVGGQVREYAEQALDQTEAVAANGKGLQKLLKEQRQAAQELQQRCSEDVDTVRLQVLGGQQMLSGLKLRLAAMRGQQARGEGALAQQQALVDQERRRQLTVTRADALHGHAKETMEQLAQGGQGKRGREVAQATTKAQQQLQTTLDLAVRTLAFAKRSVGETQLLGAQQLKKWQGQKKQANTAHNMAQMAKQELRSAVEKAVASSEDAANVTLLFTATRRANMSAASAVAAACRVDGNSTISVGSEGPPQRQDARPEFLVSAGCADAKVTAANADYEVGRVGELLRTARALAQERASVQQLKKREASLAVRLNLTAQGALRVLERKQRSFLTALQVRQDTGVKALALTKGLCQVAARLGLRPSDSPCCQIMPCSPADNTPPPPAPAAPAAVATATNSTVAAPASVATVQNVTTGSFNATSSNASSSNASRSSSSSTGGRKRPKSGGNTTAPPPPPAAAAASKAAQAPPAPRFAGVAKPSAGVAVAAILPSTRMEELEQAVRSRMRAAEQADGVSAQAAREEMRTINDLEKSLA